MPDPAAVAVVDGEHTWSAVVLSMRIALTLTIAISLGVLVGAGLFLLTVPTSAPGSKPVGSSPAAPGGRGSETEPAPRVGAPAPDINLTALDGTSVTLSSLRGRVVLVNFCASWCGPCKQEMTDLQRLYSEEREHGLVVLDVNDGEEPGRAAGFLARYGVTFPTVTDADRSVTRTYQVFGLPNSFLIDGEGVVRARVVGPITREQMLGYLEQARQGKDVPPPSVRSVAAATIGEAERPVGEVSGSVVTLVT